MSSLFATYIIYYIMKPLYVVTSYHQELLLYTRLLPYPGPSYQQRSWKVPGDAEQAGSLVRMRAHGPALGAIALLWLTHAGSAAHIMIHIHPDRVYYLEGYYCKPMSMSGSPTRTVRLHGRWYMTLVSRSRLAVLRGFNYGSLYPHTYIHKYIHNWWSSFSVILIVHLIPVPRNWI
jgi:hypothetical protein